MEGKKKAKVMKIDGERFKLKTPIRAWDVVKDHPVKHFGIRAKPLEPQQDLKPKRIYFLVELPKLPEEKAPRRDGIGSDVLGPDSGGMRVKMRQPKSQMAKLVEESRDGVEVAEKILNLYVENAGGDTDINHIHREAPWKPDLGRHWRK
ncbi:hypothetical protein DITRI_Ditri08aG0048800 [Diplodiscus trichospermus]